MRPKIDSLSGLSSPSEARHPVKQDGLKARCFRRAGTQHISLILGHLSSVKNLGRAKRTFLQ